MDGVMLKYSKDKYCGNPFLSIITRVYKRPVGLSQNLASIHRLKDKDIEQIFIHDNVGVGMFEANKSFGNNEVRSLIDGEYVYLLDDDDFIVNPGMIGELKKIAKEHTPDVIFFRMIIKLGQIPGDLYPTNDLCWGVKPVIARIGGSCFVVKKEIYLKHIHEFAKPRCGDFYFINAVFESGAKCYWHDKVQAETGKVSRGKPENA